MDSLTSTHAPRPTKGQLSLHRLRTLAEDCRNEIARAGGNTSEIDAFLAHLSAEVRTLRTGAKASDHLYARQGSL